MACCRGSENSAVRNTFILGGALSLSFLLIILAAAIYHDYLPFINIAFVVLVPIAVIIADMTSSGASASYSETAAAWANFGNCMFGVIMVSMFGLPLVLLHTGEVSNQGFALWIASTVVTVLAATWYWVARRRKDY